MPSSNVSYESWVKSSLLATRVIRTTLRVTTCEFAGMGKDKHNKIKGNNKVWPKLARKNIEIVTFMRILLCCVTNLVNIYLDSASVCMCVM